MTRHSIDSTGPCRETWNLGTWPADDLVVGGLAVILVAFALILMRIAAKDRLRG